jgi:hypothetical protein
MPPNGTDAHAFGKPFFRLPLDRPDGHLVDVFRFPSSIPGGYLNVAIGFKRPGGLRAGGHNQGIIPQRLTTNNTIAAISARAITPIASSGSLSSVGFTWTSIFHHSSFVLGQHAPIESHYQLLLTLASGADASGATVLLTGTTSPLSFRFCSGITLPSKCDLKRESEPRPGMYRTHIVYQLWVILTLIVLIGVPIAILATRLSTLDVVCFDILDLQYRPLPTDILQQPEDRLSLIAGRLHSGNATICTNEDSNIRSDLEAQWNRLLSLTVSLRSPNHTILTAQSADARNPYDFYALASHELRLDVTHDMMTELLFTQALILALSGLIWFTLHRLLGR